jgi:16S rRNA (guanine1207-N2)-methyltransferase
MSQPLPDPAPRALRLSLAFEAGLVLPDEGSLVVLHPRAGEDISILPRDRVQIVTPHAPDHAAYEAQGYCCAQEIAEAAAAIVCLPRGRDEARDLIAQAAAATEGPVILDGQKTDGIEAHLRALKGRVELSGPISKGHGKIVWFTSPGARVFDDWRAEPRAFVDANGRSFVTRPGVFSADGVDPGSALLSSVLPVGMKGVVVDLGAGWGWLSATLLAQAPAIEALHLLESDARALDCARANVSDPRAVFHWVDATRPLSGLRADHVITNPPFHQGRAGQPALGQAFIRAASATLAPAGKLWLVANRHLPYEVTLTQAFASHHEIANEGGFKVLVAEKPRKTVKTKPTSRRASH